MNPTKSMIAVLFALGSAGALAQDGAAPQPPTGKPVSDSATYGPVLHPQQPTPATTQQPTPASTHAAGEARPQAQEERAGQPPVTGKQHEVDPSARPAPEATQPQTGTQTGTQAQPRQQPQSQQERRQTKKEKQARRRPGAVQRVEGTPRIAAPAPAPSQAYPAPAVPTPVGPQTSQVVGCMGSACTDAGGATYNAGGPGNTTVSSSGRLCTRNGANMQCL
jgi:hypothetical protein